MTGRCHHTDLKRAQVDDRIFRQRFVFKANMRGGAGADLRACLMCDLAASGNKIRMQVSIEDMRQLNPTLGCDVQITVHIAKRVDQNPLLSIVGANQIGRVAQPLIHKRFDEISLHHDLCPYVVE